tara:strand:+ start:39 stop:443 length:405 start_codon:yes stop_codon:yes gene_type:complete
MIKGAWQLSAVSVRYCAHGGSSRGAREFIRSSLVPYAEKHAHVAFDTVQKGGKHPCVIANYVTGRQKVADVKNKTAEEVAEVVEMFRNTSGRKMTKFGTTKVTEKPTIQGGWRANIEFPEYVVKTGADTSGAGL